MTLETFFYEFIDETFCDFKRRPKTVRAFKTLCERVPDSDIDELPSITVIAPHPRTPAFCTYGTKAEAIIYLDYSLEKKPQTEVDFSVAHEFAHALKGHFRKENMVLTPEQVKAGYLNWNVEVEADELAATWGYTIPKRRKRKIRKGRPA